MDAKVTDEEVRWVISQMAARTLTRMGDPERREALKAAVRDWFPDTSKVDEFELRRITDMVAVGFHGMANLVDERLKRLMINGKARVLDGSGQQTSTS